MDAPRLVAANVRAMMHRTFDPLMREYGFSVTQSGVYSHGDWSSCGVRYESGEMRFTASFDEWTHELECFFLDDIHPDGDPRALASVQYSATAIGQRLDYLVDGHTTILLQAFDEATAEEILEQYARYIRTNFAELIAEACKNVDNRRRKSESMPRSAGWSVLAKEALELGVLALAAWATEREAPQVPHLPAIPEETALAVEPAAPLAVEPEAPLMVEPEAPLAIDEASMPRDEFLKVIADANTRYYRAYDGEGEMEVAFYDDGRLRMADERHRFAGMVQNGHAHMLQIGTDDWTEVFVRTTPDGVLQLELRDGPHDGRVLTCEADNLRMIAER